MSGWNASQTVMKEKLSESGNHAYQSNGKGDGYICQF